MENVLNFNATDVFWSQIDTEDQEWMKRGLCAQTDPEAFYPEKGGSTREAKRICQGCEVKGECLEYAIANKERYGIWGGVSERDRRAMCPASTRQDPKLARVNRAAEIPALDTSGGSVRWIAEQAGVSERTVLRARTAAGPPQPNLPEGQTST